MEKKRICKNCYKNHYEKIKAQVRKEKKSNNIDEIKIESHPKKESNETFSSSDGRIRRSTYFFRSLLLTIPVGLVLLTLQSSQEPGLLILISLVSIVFGILQIIQTIKRLHDINLEGEYILLGLIPIVNFLFSLYLLFKEGTNGSNKYGEDPKKNERVSVDKSKLSTEGEIDSIRKQTSLNESGPNLGLEDLEKLAELKK